MGKERAVRSAAMPEELLIPIAAASVDAIIKHIGSDYRSLPRTRNDNALLVRNEWGPERTALAVWEHSSAGVLNSTWQLWVRTAYNGYRRAYKMAFPDENIRSKVIHHVMNRRYASLHGFEYVRVVPVSRSANSSSGFSENWGVELTKSGVLRSRRGREMIGYADIAHLMSMLNTPIGGGVMDTVREAVALLQVGTPHQ